MFKYILFFLLFIPFFVTAQEPGDTIRIELRADTFFIQNKIHGQEVKIDRPSVYHIRYGIDVPLTAVAFVTNYIGLRRVNTKPRLDSAAIVNLDPNKVPAIDRGALRQDPEFFGVAHTISDIAMKTSFAAPFLLVLDNKVRPDWLSVILLYLETEALIGNVYSWGVAQFNRVRPFVYHPDAPLNEKLSHGTTNSFYSGHVASTTAATIYMAKVLSDYHPEWRNKWMLYGAAMVPSVFVGVFRYKAGKHFPTDVLAGMPAGVAVGLLVPQLHKWKTKRNVAITPFSGEYNGLSLNYNF